MVQLVLLDLVLQFYLQVLGLAPLVLAGILKIFPRHFGDDLAVQLVLFLAVQHGGQGLHDVYAQRVREVVVNHDGLTRLREDANPGFVVFGSLSEGKNDAVQFFELLAFGAERVLRACLLILVVVNEALVEGGGDVRAALRSDVCAFVGGTFLGLSVHLGLQIWVLGDQFEGVFVVGGNVGVDVDGRLLQMLEVLEVHRAEFHVSSGPTQLVECLEFIHVLVLHRIFIIIILNYAIRDGTRESCTLLKQEERYTRWFSPERGGTGCPGNEDEDGSEGERASLWQGDVERVVGEI